MKGLLAYGFNPELTKVVLDFNYPEIFNIAMNLSKGLNFTKVNGVYGYSGSTNVGLCFYPAVQAAHVIFPEIRDGTKNTLVPIGPDEDAHLRLGRELAEKFGYAKPAILHARFMPDINMEKMSKSRPDGVIYLTDDADSIKRKIKRSFSGGGKTLEEHRKFGGKPDNDVAIIYLSSYFLQYEESRKLKSDYRKGKVTSGEVKEMLIHRLTEFSAGFNRRFGEVDETSFAKILMPNSSAHVNPVLLELFRHS